jgi:hypothetical protein
MRTLKESIFDEKENEDKLDNTVHVNSIKRAWDKNWNKDYDIVKDFFGRDLNIGDLVYSMQFGYVGIVEKIDTSGREILVSCKYVCGYQIYDPDYPSHYILIPKSCTKEFLKVITAKK